MEFIHELLTDFCLLGNLIIFCVAFNIHHFNEYVKHILFKLINLSPLIKHAKTETQIFKYSIFVQNYIFSLKIQREKPEIYNY